MLKGDCLAIQSGEITCPRDVLGYISPGSNWNTPYWTSVIMSQHLGQPSPSVWCIAPSSTRYDSHRAHTSSFKTIHRLLTFHPYTRPVGQGLPSPYELLERAKIRKGRSDSFGDATFNDRLWATGIVADRRLEMQRGRYKESQDPQLMQLFGDGMYDQKDTVSMTWQERRCLRYSAVTGTLLWDHIGVVEDEVPRFV
jgi:hypothetical protein